MKTIKAVYSYVLGPLALLTMVLSAAVLFIASPMVWEAFYQAPEKVAEHGYHDGITIAAHLWSDTPYAEVSDQLKGGRLVPREIVHYEDLQNKFRQLLLLFSVCLLSAIPAAFLKNVRKVLWLSLSWLLVMSGVFTVWALYDWRDFFHTLHWWIFQNASWKLPWGCYSLQLYPYPVWKSACAVVIAFSVFLYLVFFALSFLKKSK